MTERPAPILKKQHIVVVLLVLIIGALMIDLNTRLGNLSKLRQQESELQTQVSVLKATDQFMATEVAFATSEAAVDEWARRLGHYYRPGDIPIIPLAPNESTPERVQLATPQPQVSSNWEVWQALFFGK
ncbi:MAG: hypothetical protein HPY76_13905 [Anaerolineae bacterium]|jgi:cell division protein FtsB|nr:hypothetical protein [Anaerolineae bacterium]